MKRTKIALVQPFVNPGKSLGVKKSPTGIQSVAAQLEREGYDVKVIHNYTKVVLKELKVFKPEHVGISCMTNNYPEAEEIARGIKAISKRTSVTLGGWHVSGCINSYVRGMERETLEEILHRGSPFDYIIRGEGEVSYLRLLEMLSKGGNEEAILKISGVGFVNKKRQTVLNTKIERIMDLDSLAFPSWSGVEIDEYRDGRTKELDLSIHAQRSCRFFCEFCATPLVYPGRVARLSPKRTVDYIEMLLRFKPRVITFTDEDFFSDPEWVRGVAEEIVKRGINKKGVKIDTFASVYDLHLLEKNGDGELLDLMKKAGFSSFTLGIESFNPKTLRAYNKEGIIKNMMSEKERERYDSSSQEEKDSLLTGVYLERTQKAIDFARGYGILCIGDYMVGYFGESPEQVKRGFKLFSEIQHLLFAYIPVFTPIPGTGVWKPAYDSRKLRRDKNGGIGWSAFDASEGAMNLGYGVRRLRDMLEQEFYTSQRYRKDMMEEIKRNPSSIRMFRDRFNFLHRNFPEKKKIKRMMEELCS